MILANYNYWFQGLEPVARQIRKTTKIPPLRCGQKCGNVLLIKRMQGYDTPRRGYNLSTSKRLKREGERTKRLADIRRMTKTTHQTPE